MKPISIAMMQTKQAITTAITTSGLPACVLLPIMKELTQAVSDAADMQLAKDVAAYEKEEEDGSEEDNRQVEPV